MLLQMYLKSFSTIVLSTAYNTLSQPSKKLTYDTHQKFSDLSQYTPCCSEDNAVDIFQQVIRQVKYRVNLIPSCMR
jgi:hypothetical protein